MGSDRTDRDAVRFSAGHRLHGRCGRRLLAEASATRGGPLFDRMLDGGLAHVGQFDLESYPADLWATDCQAAPPLHVGSSHSADRPSRRHVLVSSSAPGFRTPRLRHCDLHKLIAAGNAEPERPRKMHLGHRAKALAERQGDVHSANDPREQACSMAMADEPQISRLRKTNAYSMSNQWGLRPEQRRNSPLPGQKRHNFYVFSSKYRMTEREYASHLKGCRNLARAIHGQSARRGIPTPKVKRSCCNLSRSGSQASLGNVELPCIEGFRTRPFRLTVHVRWRQHAMTVQ